MRGSCAFEIYPMQIVLFLDLPPQLPVNSKSDQIGVILCVRIRSTQSVLQVPYCSPCSLSFLVDAIFEVPRKAFNLLDLLAQITSEACELHDYIFLNGLGFIALRYGVFMKIS